MLEIGIFGQDVIISQFTYSIIGILTFISLSILLVAAIRSEWPNNDLAVGIASLLVFMASVFWPFFLLVGVLIACIGVFQMAVVALGRCVEALVKNIC